MVNRVFVFRGSGGGFVSDSNPFTLSDDEWSDVNNVRIHNRAVSKIAGHTRLYSGTQATEPRHLQFSNGSGTNQFYYYIDENGDTNRINAAGSTAVTTNSLGSILTAGQITAISKAANAVITSSVAVATTVQVGDRITVAGVTGATAFNGDYIISLINSARTSLTTTRATNGISGTGVFSAATASAVRPFA